MISKVMFLLLGAILLLQSHNAAPNQEKDSAISGLEERIKLQKLFSTGIDDLNLIILREGATVLELVLKDPKVLDIKTDSMKAKLEEIRNFIKDVRDFEAKEKKEDSDFGEFDHKFDRIVYRVGLKNSEDEIIKQSLKDNGLIRLSPAAEAHIKALTDKICEELEKYGNGLNETEKKDQTDILDLMEALKILSDPKARFELIARFTDH